MNPWTQMDSLKREGDNLEAKLSEAGWDLMLPQGIHYRAKKRGAREGGPWREILAASPMEMLLAVGVEEKRVEALKKHGGK